MTLPEPGDVPVTVTLPDGAFTGEPSLRSRAFTAVFRAVNRTTQILGVQSRSEGLSRRLESRTPTTLFTKVFTRGLIAECEDFEGMPIWTLQRRGAPTGKVIVAIHGGGYTVDMLGVGWIAYANWARDTGAKVVVPIYPVVPEGTAERVVPTIARLVSREIDRHGAEHVAVEGESAGASIGMAAVQKLVSQGRPVPARMVLLSPALDYSFRDPASAHIDDPIIWGVEALHAGATQWAGSLPGGLSHPLVSPLFGSLAGLPPTWVYSSSLDRLCPQVLDLQQVARAQRAPFTFILRKGQLHGWPVNGFLPEAAAVKRDIEDQLTVAAPPAVG